MEEANKVICKQCGFLQTKIASGKYPNGKDIKYLNEYGGEWSGKVCPLCHRKNNRDRNRRNRHAKILYPGDTNNE